MDYFNSIDELVIEPLSDDLLDSVAGATSAGATCCSCANCSGGGPNCTCAQCTGTGPKLPESGHTTA